MKNDLIRRSALIEVLKAEKKKDRSRAYGEHECDLIAGTIAMCIDFVKEVPTAYNVEKVDTDVSEINVGNNGWIPISERLPENGVPVLFQIKKDNRMYVGYSNNVFEEFYIITAKNRYKRGINPIAWQPLPEPFNAKNKKASDYKIDDDWN